jgi:hypothetical protein
MGAAAAPVIALVLVAALAGCAETGDFGRPKPTFWNDTAGPLLGKGMATVREEPVSWSLLTDDEQELRNRAYRFLTPAKEQWGYERQIADLAVKRVIPGNMVPKDPTAYHRAIQSSGDISPRARYQRLREDIDNDRILLGRYVAVACRVQEMDVIRLKALEKMDEPGEFQAAQARARVAENEALTAWVFEETVYRLASYRYSLENLVIESPDRDAIKVERVLTAFDADRAGLERCGRRGGVTVSPAGPSVRYHPKPDKPPLPPK